MELRLETQLAEQPGARTGAPRMRMSEALHWSEENGSFSLVLEAAPEQVARFLARAGLQRQADHPYRWQPARPPQDGHLTVTVSGDGAAWAQLEAALVKLPRGRTAKPLRTMQLEWPFGHPALRTLKAGEFPLGESLLRILPANGQLMLLTPIAREQVAEMTDLGYSLHPLDDWQEEIWWEELAMGRLLKPELLGEDDGDAPFLLLHGLQHSLAHPVFMRPFLPPLPQASTEDLRRIVVETMDSSDELRLPLDGGDDEEDGELDSTFQQEYSGFDSQDLELLLRVPIALTENLATEVHGSVEDVDEEWMSTVFSLVVIAAMCGSRSARAQLARGGYDVSLDRRLGERDCMDLASGLLHFADALAEAVGDGRFAHLWSLPRREARAVEEELERLVENMPEDVDPDLAAADLYLSFDLGVRYQMARVAPELLDPPPPLALDTLDEEAADTNDDQAESAG